MQFYMGLIGYKISQRKDKMHKTQERVVTDRLWPEIETLNWVLNEILVLRQRFEADQTAK
jgi:hypothetical protein